MSTPSPNRGADRYLKWALSLIGLALVCAIAGGTALLVDGYWKPVTQAAPAPVARVLVEVTGRQWEWIIRYPGADSTFGEVTVGERSETNKLGIQLGPQSGASHDDFLSDTLFLPKGIPVRLRVCSQDVVHGAYLPHMKVQMNAVPGMSTQVDFVPKETTMEMRARFAAKGAQAQRDSLLGDHPIDFMLLCNHICGRGHYAMHRIVVVLERADYAAWYAQASRHTLYEHLHARGDAADQFSPRFRNNWPQGRVDDLVCSTYKIDEMDIAGQSQPQRNDRQGRGPAGRRIAQIQSTRYEYAQNK